MHIPLRTLKSLLRLRMSGNVSCPTFPRPGGKSPAFTLVELLAVIGIIVLMMALVLPAMNGIKGGTDLKSATSEISGMLEQARAYAMANNTYVYVGFAEVDSSVSEGSATQTPASGTAGGRVAVAVVASKDGTRGYNMSSSIPSPAWSNYNNGANLVAINKLRRFENLHLGALGAPPTSGNMARPSISNNTYLVSNMPATGSNGASVTPFAWPLGKAIGSGQYEFFKVIQFDPQGMARVQTTGNQDNVGKWIEVGLQQTHGNVVPPAPAPNVGSQTAIQIDCMTGTTRIYQP